MKDISCQNKLPIQISKQKLKLFWVFAKPSKIVAVSGSTCLIFMQSKSVWTSCQKLSLLTVAKPEMKKKYVVWAYIILVKFLSTLEHEKSICNYVRHNWELITVWIFQQKPLIFMGDAAASFHNLLFNRHLSALCSFIISKVAKLWCRLISVITGRARLIRSHSSARFCFELSGNSN